MRKTIPNLDKIFRDAIAKSGKSQNRIAIESGLTGAQLSYFVSGKRSLSLGAAAKLMPVLGLEIRPKGKRGRK